MKKQIAVVVAAVLFVGLFSGISWAGPARRHTIEGFILGAGVTLLGTAIVHNMSRPEPVVVHKKHHPSRGHWETRRIWVSPATETKWNPGHYNRRGEWVAGRYEEFTMAQGYWETQKVWVSKGRR